MNKKEYFKFNLQQQVTFINNQLVEGKSLTSTCKELLIAKSSVLAKFKKHGYKLVGSQYILKQIPEKENFKDIAKVSKLEEVAADLQEDKSVLENTNIVQKNENDVKKTDDVKIASDNTEQGEKNSKKDKNNTDKEKKTKLKAKVGRPQKYKKDHNGKNIDKKKFTLEIDKTVYKALKHKKNEEGIAINTFVEELLRKAIDEKYFKNNIE